MANQWLRLWHDMPTDPKWRTIARASGQPISLVQAVYLHLLVDASRNVTRGHATVTQEDLASALDVTEGEVESVLAAMQGRVLQEMRLLGWEARQPKREDSGDETTGAKSAAQRKQEQRERDRLAALASEDKQCHDASRNVTLDKDKEEETDKEEDKGKAPRKRAATPPPPDRPTHVDEQTWDDWLQLRKKKSAPVTATVLKEAMSEAEKAGVTLDRFLSIWCARGSQGLEASWLKPNERGNAQPNGETAYQRSMRERMQQIVPGIAARAPGVNSIIEMEAADATPRRLDR